MYNQAFGVDSTEGRDSGGELGGVSCRNFDGFVAGVHRVLIAHYRCD